MKCISCEVEINPKWTHAIDINICPFCGKNVLDQDLKNLLSSLRETMDKLSAYPDQLNDWMISNHNFIKTDSKDLHLYVPKGQIKNSYVENDDIQERKNKKFTVKVKTENGDEEDVVAEKIQSEEKTNDFFKRAEAVKPNIDGFKNTAEKTQHLKSVVQQIRREGSTVTNNSGMIRPEMMEMADPDIVAEMQSVISGGDMPLAKESDYNMDDEIPSVVLNMAKNAGGGGGSGGGNHQSDLLKLQQLQNKVANSHNRFLSGAGKFSRA